MKYIHAGNAPLVVDIANKARGDVYLHKDKVTVDAKSILGVMSLVSFDGVSVETEEQEIAKAIVEVFE
jgi:phosphotransferase system HPr (HPr) family protein